MNQTIIYHVLSDESLDKKLKEILLTKEESLIERYHGVIIPSSWVVENPVLIAPFCQSKLTLFSKIRLTPYAKI
ncbi:hypothetical protein LDB17_11215, partial [Dysgonomonas sp. Shenzhen-Wh21]|uniref:hypothetical protein n=1 Tax=Dysgonomonas sp. Shenzhen-Wh21 TaxID=2878548 RepID=UPI00372D439F